MSQDNNVGQSLKRLGAGAAAGAGEPSPHAADPAPVLPAAAAPVATTKLPASLPAVASRGRQKPLLQLLALVAARAHVLGLLLLLASVCGLLALPLLDRAVRFDEKGLLAGLAAPTIGQAAAGGQLMRAARRIARSATATTAATTSKGRTVAAFQSPAAPAALAAALAAAGLTETQLTRPLVRMPGLLLPNSSASSGPSPGAAAVRPGWCRCANLHVLVRARRGDGLEALAVVTPVAFAPPAAADAALDGWAQTAAGAELGLAAGAALALHLAAPAEAAGGGGRWLSRDVLWVVPDLSCGVSACLAAWVDGYTGGAGGGRDGGDGGGGAAAGGGGWGQGHSRSGSGAAAAVAQQQQGQGGEEGPQAGAWDTEVRLRGGVIQQAVVLEALIGAGPHDGGGGGGGQAVQLLAMGSGGLLPKLDMYWLLRYMFGWPTTPALWRDDGRLDGSQAWVAAALQRLTGGSAGAAAGLASRLLRALHFAWQQAVGRPAGAHAAFKGAGVDAAGVRLVPGRLDRWAGTARPIRATDPDAPAFSSFSASSSSSASSPSAVSALEERALSLASGLELTLRSLNHLVERVHHSSFLYLLAGLDRYVSVERYVGPAAALALVVQLQAAWSMWVLRLAAAAPGGAAVGPSGAAGGPSGGAGPAVWAEAAARAAARTAACAAAAMALRVLACGDGPWAARLLVQLAPPAAVGALRAALAAPLSSPTGAAAAAAVMLLTAAAASGAAALAGRLVATAVPRRRTSSSSGAHSAAAAAGAAGAAAARAAACGVTATDASGSGDGSLPQSWGADAGAGSAATALSLRWHAERVLVLTATAAALAALVCLNWAAAAVAGFYLAKMAVAQGLAAAAVGGGCGGTRLRVPGQPKKQGQGQGQGLGAAVAERELAAAGRPPQQRSALGRCVAAAAWALGAGLWLLASPLTALVVVVLLTEAVGLGGGLRSGGGLAAAADSALGWGVGPGVCVGLSAANYWFAAVVAAPFWLFGLEGWLAQAQLRL